MRINILQLFKSRYLDQNYNILRPKFNNKNGLMKKMMVERSTYAS